MLLTASLVTHMLFLLLLTASLAPPVLFLLLLTASLAPPILLLLLLIASKSPLALLLNVVNNLSGLQYCKAYQASGLSEQLKIIHQNVFMSLLCFQFGNNMYAKNSICGSLILGKNIIFLI